MQSKSSDKASDPLIGRLEAIVLEHMANEDFDVETFSNLSGLSRTNLYRKLKKHTGKSVTEFVRDIRLKKSLEYLRDGERTASEVAYLVGFSSATYFNKCFKDRYGFTPGDANHYRERIDEILQTQSEETGKKNRKTSLFKPILLIALVIGIALIGWVLSKTNNNDEPKIELNIPIDSTNLEEIVSIAVLPIIDNTVIEGHGYEESTVIGYKLIDLIKSMDSVDYVAPMSVVRPYRDSLTLPHSDIAKKIGVKFTLSSELLYNKQDDKFILSLELNDAQDNNLWIGIKEYKRNRMEERKKAFNEIVFEIAKTFGFNISEDLYDRNSLGTDNFQAYEHWANGFQKLNTSTKEGVETAIIEFNKAIELDPDYYDAYYELANLWQGGGMILGYIPQDSAWANAKSIYRKMLELKPGDFKARGGLANGYFYYELNISDTIPKFFGFDYDEWIAHRGDHAEKKGLHTITHDNLKEWFRRNPKRGQTQALMAINYYFLNQPEKAIKKLDDYFPIYKNNLEFLKEASKAWYFLGEYDKMEMAVLRYFEIFDEEEYAPITRWLRAIVADKNNNQEIVQEQLQHLMNSYQNGESGSPAWFIALYHAYKKDVNKTLEWLEKSFEAREVEMTWLAQEPDLELVGDEPRYRALLDSMNFSQSARRHVVFKD